MTDHDLDLRLHAWYRSELDQIDAPTSLREAVARIPAEGRPMAGNRSLRITLLAAATLAILTVAALLAIGAGWLPRRETITPSPMPSQVVRSASPAPPSPEGPAITGTIEMPTTTVARFGEDGAPADLAAIVEGPGLVPYILDRASQAVYQVDPVDGTTAAVVRAGDRVGDRIVGSPRVMTVGGPTLFVLDDRGVLWAWGLDGGGTLRPLTLVGEGVGRDDVSVAGTFCRDRPACRLNNLYLVDPSDRMIWAYAPAAQGIGYPAAPSRWLRDSRDVADATSLYVDGDLYFAQRGAIARFTAGAAAGWAAAALEGQEGTTAYRHLASAAARDVGTLFANDAAGGRVVALAKADGRALAAYGSRSGEPDVGGLRGMYVTASDAAGATLWWIDEAAVHRSTLAAPPGQPAPSPLPSGTATPPD